MSELSKITKDYERLAGKPLVPVQKAPDNPPTADAVDTSKNIRSFEVQFTEYLEPGYLSLSEPDVMMRAVVNLRSGHESDKMTAANILTKRTKGLDKNLDETSILHYILYNIGFIAIAADACTSSVGNDLMKPIDDMCEKLIHDSDLTTTMVRDLALSDAAKLYLRQGLSVMIETGIHCGYWVKRRRNEAYLIRDLRILLLSEILLSDGKTGPYFKSLRDSKWFDLEKCLDPIPVLRTTYGVIKNALSCTVNYEIYLIALISLAAVWATKQTEPTYLNYIFTTSTNRAVSDVKYLKGILLKIFCGEETEMILFTLSELDFHRVSKLVFNYCCFKMINFHILKEAISNFGEFVVELQKLLKGRQNPRFLPLRCRDITIGLFECTLQFLFSIPNFDPREFWTAVLLLNKFIREQNDQEIMSSFQNALALRITASTDAKIIVEIPLEILLSLPKWNSAPIRELLLKHFKKMGHRLFRYYFYNRSGDENILNGCDTLLDRFFVLNERALETARREEITAYMSPLQATLEGISAECNSVILIEESTKLYRVRLSAAKAFLRVLHLPTTARAYVTSSASSEFWSDVTEHVRDRIMMTRRIQDSFPIFRDCMFRDPEVRRQAGLFEDSLRNENNRILTNGGDEFQPNRFYTSFMTGFGEAIHVHELLMDRKHEPENVFMSRMLFKCLDRSFPSDMNPLYFNQYILSYVDQTITCVLDYMRRNQYSLPGALEMVPRSLKSVLSPTRTIVCDSHFKDTVQSYYNSFEDQILKILIAFNSKTISKLEVMMLNATPSILISLDKIATKWELATGGLKCVTHDDTISLLNEFEAAENENETLSGIVTFLMQRDLCTEATDLQKYFSSRKNQTIKLSDLCGFNADLAARLNFEEDVFLALRSFTRGSEMFAVRFDALLSEISHLDSDSETTQITVRTREALRGLRDLVSSEDVRIDDFKLSLTGVLAELQGRRRSAMAAELKKIAIFFSAISEKSHNNADQGTGKGRAAVAGAGLGIHGGVTMSVGDANAKAGPASMLNNTLANLNAAFHLEKYKEVLGQFKAALADADLNLLPPNVVHDIQSSTVLEELMDNFYVSSAPRLLAEVEECLEGLTYHALMLVGKLTSAGLFISFLRNHGRSFESGALDRAQQRAISNAHASGVLMHLSSLQILLEPFYNRTFQMLSDMKAHLTEHLRMSPDGQECLSLAHLVNVCENWEEVEIYFRDGSDTNAGTEDIQRSVLIYRETGVFISALTSHPGGSSLALQYQQRGGQYVILSPEQLQAHVQWAVLGGDVPILEEFVCSFREAQHAHEIRIELEEEGHPDHQATDPPAPLATTIRIDHVTHAVTTLSDQLAAWRVHTENYCRDNPRLLLLNRRNRVQLILTLRNRASRDHNRVLGYVIQCFPSLAKMRHHVVAALIGSMTSLIFRGNLSDLALAGYLVSKMESILMANPECAASLSKEVDEEAVGEVSRLDLQGLHAVGVYCQHLSYMVSQTYSTAQPGMVLWGERSTTDFAVQDLLLVASTPGLSEAVHIVGVDRLTPRIREVLLRCIERTTLRSSLVLIFGDRDGVETFSPYQLEDAPEKHNPSNVRGHMWCCLPMHEVQKKNNTELWVVSGKSGSGKSRWINDQSQKPSVQCLHFVVHEGFTAKSVIDRYSQVVNPAQKTIALSFDVYVVACFESFSRFLHHLLALGLMIDEESGSCLAVLPSTHLQIFVELPEVSPDLDAGKTPHVCVENWPPTDDRKWHTSQHPLLALLPAVVVAVQPDHYIGVRETSPYVIDHKAALVATYLNHARNVQNFENVNLPSDEDRGNLLPAVQCVGILQQELFLKYHVSTSKRVRNFLVQVLYDRFLYLHSMRRHVLNLVHNEEEESLQDQLEVRLGGTSHKILVLFILEALAIASNAKNLPETSVFTIRPLVRVQEFEVLVATHNANSNEFIAWKDLFMEAKALIISEGAIKAELRCNIAPAFGMEDSATLVSLLKNCGHFFTPESLVRILHMHSRRMLGASVIYEGETGVGKSQNLKLYSLLINANNSIFANLELHLIAVIQAVLLSKHVTPDDAVEDEQGVSDDADTLAAITLTSSIAEIVKALTAWIRVDALDRMNRIGSAVCEYFIRLFESYPLNLEGFVNNSPAAYNTMLRHAERAATHPQDPSVLLAEETARAAEGAEYLILRPEKLSSVGDDGDCDDDDDDDDNYEDYDEDDDEDDAQIEVEHDKKSGASHALRNTPLLTCEGDLVDLLTCIVASPPFALYHRILADEGLTVLKWRTFLAGIIPSSERLLKLSSTTVICVFVDELNTAGCLGMISEAFLSHSVDGVPLPRNIFFVGAINPLRGSSAPPGTMDFTKSNIGKCDEDDTTDYLAMAPYIVRPLSPSMENIKLLYPNLDKKGEECFLREHLEVNLEVPKPADVSMKNWELEMTQFSNYAVKMIISAQELVRKYEVPRAFMSIRNLVRCSQLLSWLINFTVPTERGMDGITFNHQNIFLPSIDEDDEDRGGFEFTKLRMERSLIMAIAVTYWLQLPSHGHMLAGKAKEDLRERFLTDITRTLDHARFQEQEQASVQNWKHTIERSLTNLFSFAHIPRGLAHTTALKENFYCVVLASINKVPLLITGPPGCGKTLSYLLACDALKGNCSAHTVAFQSLQKAKKITYQCSVASTGPEISAVCDGAIVKQRHLDAQQPGRHVCLLGLDEAGLTPENRQALKSLHDHLDMREIGTVMMSNSTLDAAKTSRTIQLLQTQANMTDLMELAWGIIAAEDAENASEHIRRTWWSQVEGLCTAFQSIGTVILRDNWFHSRDFIFLCRLLRVLACKKEQTLFDSVMLVEGLRRHFQSLDPSMFPTLAMHFLTKCGLRPPPDDELDARVVRTLSDSLGDSLSVGTDPTSAHCRYTLVVDPTDCEAAVDLLFALKLLDQSATKIVSLSDFPEDASPTMTTAALAQVKKCIEDGDTLLLVNSGPLQSALYDVINRHYAVSVRDDGRTDAFANIPLGSFSSLVRVHDSFRLIVHVPLSQLPKTPMPFLNRFEKYSLSVRDALAQRVFEVSHNPPPSLLSIAKPQHRQKLFREIEAGVNDFVAFAGGSLSFYGMSSTETVPALVLRALEDACVWTNVEYEPRPSILAGMRLLKELRDEQAVGDETDFITADTGYGLDPHQGGSDRNSDDGHLQGLEWENDPLNGVNSVTDNDLETGGISLQSIVIDCLDSEAGVKEPDTSSAVYKMSRSDNEEPFDENETGKEMPINQDFVLGKDMPDSGEHLWGTELPTNEEYDIQYDMQGVESNHADRTHRHSARARHSVGHRTDPLPTRLRSLIRAINFQILETARVESVFRLRDRLPATYMRQFLEDQEHLSVVSLLHQLLRSAPSSNKMPGVTTEKLVVYTRTDSHLLRLVTDSHYAHRIFDVFTRGGGSGAGSVTASATATATASAYSHNDDTEKFLTMIVSSVDSSPGTCLNKVMCIIPLADFTSSTDCARTIRACMRPEGGARVLIVVADMKQVLAPQVTFARQVVDKEMARCVAYQAEKESECNSFIPLPCIVFVLHVPSDQLQLRPCYQTIPLNGWSAVYVDAFCDGLIALDGSRVGDALCGVEGEVQSEYGMSNEIGADHSPQWMRVAFSLDNAPSLQDIRCEFSHLAQSALTQAVYAVSLEQVQPRDPVKRHRPTRKQFFQRAGVVLSLPAYGVGDKDWVVQMLLSRPYIVQTLTDSFALLWTQLLQHTVQENCEKLAMGGTSRGLVESVRASHKWLLSDFMLAIVKRDLAADWALEAIAALPERLMPMHTTSTTAPNKSPATTQTPALPTPSTTTLISLPTIEDGEDVTISGVKCEDSNQLSDDNENEIEDFQSNSETGVTPNSTPADLAALTVSILKGVIVIKSNDHIQQQVLYSSVSSRVDCGKTAVAPKIPLYQSLFNLLERLVPKSRHRAHRTRTTESVASEIHCEATALSALLTADALYVDIARAVQIIDCSTVITAAWRTDFITVTLGYAGRNLHHTDDELEALSKIASTLPALSSSGKGDLCRWLLLKGSLQSYLFSPSKLLIATRGILLDDDLRTILDMVEKGRTNVSSEGKEENDVEGYQERRGRGRDMVNYDITQSQSHTHTQTPGDNSVIIPHLTNLCITRLWILMFDLASDDIESADVKKCGAEPTRRDLDSWMQCIRDMLCVEAFSLESLLCDAGLGVEVAVQTQEDSRLFCAMAAVAQIIAITGLPLSAFYSIVDLDYESLSDILHLTLSLLCNTADELYAREAADTLQIIDAGSRGAKKILGQATTACLEWLFSSPLVISVSAAKDILLSGLLGTYSTQMPPSASASSSATASSSPTASSSASASAVVGEDFLQQVFESLTLNARCRFLGVLMHDNMTTDRETEHQMNYLLHANLSSQSSPTDYYVPHIAAAAVECGLVRNLFNSLDVPLDRTRALRFEDSDTQVTVHTIVFRTIFLSQMVDSKDATIQKCADEFHLANRVVRQEGDAVGCVARIAKASRIVHLLDSVSDLLSIGGVDNPVLLNLNTVTTAVATAIASSPRVWGIYLLSRLNNVNVVVGVVQCKGLLDMLGLPWLYQPVLGPTERILPAEFATRQKAKDIMAEVLTAISYSSALIKHESLQLDLKSPTSVAVDILAETDLSLASKPHTVNEAQRAAAAFVRMLTASEMAGDLAMNVYIPSVLAMYSFLRDKLAFRLTDISVARTLLVTDAINKLPVDDRLIGRKLFREFIAAWGVLRAHFVTYDVCGREVGAARSIPELSEKTALVSMLLEIEKTEVHECLPAMILETRLLKLTNHVLRHDTLTTLAADKIFNRHEFLSEEVRVESVSCLSVESLPQLFLTGPRGTSKEGKQGEVNFNAVVACYTSWTLDSPPPEIPSLTEGVKVDMETAVMQLKVTMAREAQQQAHTWGMILCPRCSNRYERASGCEHVTCGNPHQSYAGSQQLPPVVAGTCGLQLNANTNRVPAPVAGQPPLKCFLDEADLQHINASLITGDAPAVPQFPTPSGRYEIDWISIATHLFATTVRGRLDLTVDNDFFSPLPYALEGDDDVKSDPATTGVGAGVGTTRDTADRLLGKDRHIGMRGVGDIYTRLHLAADMVTTSLAEITANTRINDNAATTSKASAIGQKGTNPTLYTFSLDMALPKEQKKHIQNTARRQDEKLLEEMCDQALCLCLGTLGLIAEGYFDDLGVSPLSADLPVKYRLKALLAKISHPPGAKGWSALLINIIGDTHLTHLFPALKCMAIVGTDGVACSLTALSVELPAEDKMRLQSMQSKLIEDVKAGKCDVTTVTEDLQTISSLLADTVDQMLNTSDNKLLIDFMVIAKYVKEHSATLGVKILSKLRVRHYGQVLHFLRKTLGMIAYFSLQAAQISYDQKGVRAEHGGGTIEGGGADGGVGDNASSHSATITTSAAAHVHVHVPVTYRELVPTDWECLQDTSEAEANPELCIPAPSLLLEHQTSRIREESVGEDEVWSISKGSLAAEIETETENGIEKDTESKDKIEIKEDIKKEVMTKNEEKNSISTSLLTSEELPSKGPGPNISEAWAILTNPLYAKDPTHVETALLELGVDSEESLVYCEEEHVRAFASLLKMVPSKRLLVAWRLM